MVNRAPVYHEAGIKRFHFFLVVHSTETSNCQQYGTKSLSTASVLARMSGYTMMPNHISQLLCHYYPNTIGHQSIVYSFRV